MNTEELTALVINALEDMKAVDIRKLEIGHISSVTDTLVIVSGTSSRHVKSIANNVVMDAKKAGMPPLGVEGDDVGEWVLVDLGDVVVHVMTPEIRDFYNLEKLWTVDNVPAEQQAE